LAVLEPLGARQGLTLGAVAISAAVIGRALVAAGVTLLQVTAQGGSPAEFDGAHHAPLPARERSCVLLPIRRTIAAEHIRHFKLGTLQRPAVSEVRRGRWSGLRFGGGGLREQIEGTGGRTDLAIGNA